MPLNRATIGRWLRLRLTEEGPTEVFGLMRLAAVAVTWSRMGAAMVPHGGMESWGSSVAALFWVSSTAMFLGIGARLASLLTAVSIFLVYVDHPLFGDDHLRSHHVMAQGLVCFYLAFTPCDRAFVWGRPLAASRPGPLWALHVMRLQLAVMYAGATWEKVYPAWLSGARMEHIVMRVFTGSDPLSWPWRVVAFVAANGTVLVEAGLCIAPLWVQTPRARWAAYGVAMAFHGLVYAFTPVSTFSATMAVWWLVVLPIDGVQQLVHRFLPRPAEPITASEGPGRFGMGVLVLAALALLGPLTGWAPDRAGFDSLGDDACVVELEDGRQVAGRRSDVKPSVCTAGALERARCVVDGVWTDVDLAVVCAPLGRGPRRRVPAR